MNQIIARTTLIVFTLLLIGCTPSDNKQDANDGVYVTRQQFEETLKYQMKSAKKDGEWVRKHIMAHHEEIRLNYLFYTNSKMKAQRLTEALEAKGYTANYFDLNGNGTKYEISGMTNAVRMPPFNYVKWVKEMCEIGYKHDCLLDSWATIGI